MPSPPQMAAGLLALVIAGAFTFFGSNHKPPPAPPPKVHQVFEDLSKGDKLASAEPTIRIAKVIPKAAEPAPETESTAEAPKDICERHGGWKQTFRRHHRESWRCIIPRRRR